MIEIVMPRLSDSMEEGTILRWLAAEGESIARGDELVEIESDKAAMVHNSDGDGRLEILAAEGATLAVGELIGRLHSGDQPADSEPATAEPLASEEAIAPPPAAVPAPATPAAQAGAAPLAPAADKRIAASPVARRIATDLGVDLAAIKGSGPNGRIVREDVEEAAGVTREKADVESDPTVVANPSADTPPVADSPLSADPESQAGSSEPLATAKGAVTRIEPSKSQQLIARRMSESRATIPDFTLESDIDASRLADLREQLKELAPDGPAPTVNDLVVRACALALREHPQVNGAWRDGAFEQYARVNIGFAVSTEAGLVVPVIFDADSKDIHAIAAESRQLASRARDGSITPPELSGGTFSVSNLGMFGIDRFTAVINPPQAAILAVGALREAPVVHEGEVVAGSRLALTLATDHRAVYGAEAAAFLADISERLAAPAALLG